MSDVIATRAFTMADQASFALLSGDANPMHVDRIAARRTEPGEPIVHAMLGVLWALDVLCERGIVGAMPNTIDARFARFIYPDTSVSLEVVERTPDLLRAALSVGGQAAFSLAIGSKTRARSATPPRDGAAIEIPASPIVVEMSEMQGRFGLLPSMVDERITDAFPSAAGVLGGDRVKGMAALSALVGMVVPGMHSIFSRFDVDLVDTKATGGALAFDVRKVDDRFRIVDIAVEGSGLKGTAFAFARKPPVVQRAVKDLAGVVRSGEFDGARALVVGGSRGLGAATAKIVAAGGGSVVVTYLVGEEEARALVAEIGPARCTAVRFDAREEPAPQLDAVDLGFDTLYYFATPQVRRQKSTTFESERRDKLLDLHVHGFRRLCSYIHARSARPIGVFYPSTTALDDAQREPDEVMTSKQAAEALCAEIASEFTEMRITAKRLPPVLTDQTAAVKPVKLLDAVDVMLPIVRALEPGTDAETGVPQRA